MSLSDIQLPNRNTVTVPNTTPFGAYPGVINSSNGGVNVAIGTNALAANGSQTSNVAIGTNALTLMSGSQGVFDVAFGKNTGANLGAAANIGSSAIGYQAMMNTTGSSSYNTIMGSSAFKTPLQISYVEALGSDIFSTSTATVSTTTIIGSLACSIATTSFRDVWIGNQAGYKNAGSVNVGIGSGVGAALTNGINNTMIGLYAGSGYTGAESGNIVIGNNGTALDVNTIRVGNSSHTYLIVPSVSNVITSTNALVIDTTSFQIGSPGPLTFFAMKNLKSNDTKNLHKLAVIEYDWTILSTEHGAGLLAEQVEKYYPEICTYRLNQSTKELIGIDYIKLVPLLVRELTHLKSKLSTVKKLKKK